MTTQWQCPDHGPIQPGQIVHDGRQYSCSICGQRLQAVSDDAGARIIRQLEASLAEREREVVLLAGDKTSLQMTVAALRREIEVLRDQQGQAGRDA